MAFSLIWGAQRRLIYFPFGEVPAPPAVGLSRAEPVTLTTEDRLSLHGWFIPANAAGARLTAIVFNGNAGNRAFRAPLAAAFAQHGIATLLFDYRGFGGNPGSPSEEGLAMDARAARAYIASRPGIDPGGVVYFGESLGSGVAVRLASEQPPRALILRSPFTSLVDMGRHHYPFLPVRWLLQDRFDSLDRISRIASPLLIIAGDRDSIVPASQSRHLHEAAIGPKQLVLIDGSDHNDYELLAGPRLIAAVVDFLQKLPLSPAHN